MPNRRRGRPPEEVAALARTLVGRSLTEAERAATRAGCSVRDRSEPGWYTDDLDPHRIDVVVLDGIVVEAGVG